MRKLALLAAINLFAIVCASVFLAQVVGDTCQYIYQDPQRQENWKAFDEAWFKKHQVTLLTLLNSKATSRLTRSVLCFCKEECPASRQICAIGPNRFSYDATLLPDGREQITTDFKTQDKFSRRIYFSLRPLWWIAHTWDEVADYVKPRYSFGLSSLTAYGDDNVTTCEGAIAQNTTNATWAAIRDGSGNTLNQNAANHYGFRLGCFPTTNKWIFVYRSIYTFDTSSIGGGNTVSAAVFSCWSATNPDSLSCAPDADVYTATPASNNILVNGDYTQVGTVSQTGAALSYATINVNTFIDFTFNATGRGNISLTGISKFGIRNANYDVANVPPTWQAGSNKYTGWIVYSFDSYGTGNGPRIVITYAAGGGGSPTFNCHLLSGN